MLFRIAKREDPDQTASSVFQGLFSRQLEFKIFDHLPESMTGRSSTALGTLIN